MKKFLTLLIVLQLGLVMISQGFEGALAGPGDGTTTAAPGGQQQVNPAPAPAPAPGAAPINPNIGSFYQGPFKSTDTTRYSFDGLITKVLPGAASWIAGFLGAIAVLFLIWAGIQFLTAEGDPDKISTATKTAFYVIAGVLLVMFASALVYLFLTIFAPSLPQGSSTPQPAPTAPATTPSDGTPAPDLPRPLPAGEAFI